jgi:uncharacterized protein with PIN domain
MIVDTSALASLLRGEPEARRFAEAIADADQTAMSTANYQ